MKSSRLLFVAVLGTLFCGFLRAGLPAAELVLADQGKSFYAVPASNSAGTAWR